MKEIVNSHSGFRYAEKPKSFQWQEKELFVKQIISEQKTKEGYRFIIITDTDSVFKLDYDEILDCWQVTPFN